MSEIESWFRDHEDGEFVVLLSKHPSTVIGDRSAPRTVVYTTKPSFLARHLQRFDLAHPVLIVGRPGLPQSTDLAHLERSPVVTNCFFLGDADPPDILIYAWLREHVAIGWLGVRDELLDRVPSTDRPRMQIPMSDAEKQTMRVLPDLCPDFRGLLGPYCSSALDRGSKIELEAAMNFGDPARR